MLDIKPSYDYEAFYNGNALQKWWKRQIAETVWDWLPDDEHLRIVDLGCGSSPIITKYGLGTTPIALDHDLGKIAFMQERFPHVNYVKGSVDKLRFLDNSFNAVLAIEVIEHLEDPDKFMAEVARICDKDGTVIIATPDYGSAIWRFVEFCYKRFKPNQYCDDHISPFDYPKLHRMALSHGLTYVNMRRVAGADMIVRFKKT